MWLCLVNGVYCFLPKDSCSSIQPLIHLLIFLACFLCDNTFFPLCSGCTVPERSITARVQSLMGGPGCTHWMNTCINNKWSRRKWKVVVADRKWKFKDGLRGAQSKLYHTEHVLPLVSTAKSFTAPHDPCCSCKWRGKGGGEGSPCRERCLHHLPTLFTPHPLLSLFL